ncbi:hypothetical protein ACVWZ4_001086 [Bradyrhizobium sp. USDA 4472]
MAAALCRAAGGRLHDEPRSGAPRTSDVARIEANRKDDGKLPRNTTHRVLAVLQKPAACQHRRCNVSRRPWAHAAPGCRHQSSRPIRTLWPKCAALLRVVAGTRHRCVLRKSLKYNRWTAVNRCCRCVSARSPEGATIIKDTAPHRCSPPSTAIRPVIGKSPPTAEFSKFLETSRLPCRANARPISS